MQMNHDLKNTFATRGPVRVLLIGCGGTGSAVLLQLPFLHQALVAWGRRDGLEVTVTDGDTVSETNCVRQPFALTDIGQNKAQVLVTRINTFWNLNWKAVPEYFAETTAQRYAYSRFNLVISCVDSRRARAAIANIVSSPRFSADYLLDFGNAASHGQYVLGQPLNCVNRRRATRLRTAYELFPQLSDPTLGEDDLPSCSAAEALERQEPFINQTLATSALAMIARLLRYGSLPYHGALYNAATGGMTPLQVDPAMWEQTRKRQRSMIRQMARSTNTKAKRPNKRRLVKAGRR